MRRGANELAMTRVMIQLPEDLIEWVNERANSNNLSFAATVRQLLTAEQMKEAVAPLVPDHLCADRGHPLISGLGACLCGLETMAEPKPKARRKKVDAVVTQRGIQPSDIQIPVRCHCKRGMIIAAGPRKGQCTVCGNPKPVKEPI